MGFVRWASHPAARLFSSSSLRAWAVRATMGVGLTFLFFLDETDLSRGCIAVHHGHLHIHENEIVDIGYGIFRRLSDRFLPCQVDSWCFSDKPAPGNGYLRNRRPEEHGEEGCRPRKFLPVPAASGVRRISSLPTAIWRAFFRASRFTGLIRYPGMSTAFALMRSLLRLSEDSINKLIVRNRVCREFAQE